MNFLLRKFLLLLALSVAVAGPAMAKDESKTTKSKLKSGLISKKSGKSTDKKTAAKKTIKSKIAKKSAKGTTSTRKSDGKAQYKNTTVNINKASASALSAMLVGIGPIKAKEIVEYRKKNGKFSSLEDLMKVDGVGAATYDGLKKNISLTRGEFKAPEGYKMGDATKKTTSGKSTTKKKTGSSLERKKAGLKGVSKSGSLKSRKEVGAEPKKKIIKKTRAKKTTAKKKTSRKKPVKSKKPKSSS